MVNENYVQGRRAEYRCRDYFKSQGYQSWRMAGSHGPFDVIAISGDEVILAQVKSYKDVAGSYEEDIKKLKKLNVPANVTKMLIICKVGKGIVDEIFI